jgi:hypothetical protein
MGSYMDTGMASTAEHSTCYIAPDAAEEALEDLAAVFK